MKEGERERGETGKKERQRERKGERGDKARTDTQTGEGAEAVQTCIHRQLAWIKRRQK